MDLLTVLLILLVLGAFGTFPGWAYSSGWGYGPFGGIGLLLFIVIVFMLLGRRQ